MRSILTATPAVIICAVALAGTAAAGTDIRQEPVRFARGSSSSVIKDQIKGDTTVDYVVRAAAGQTLSVKLEKSNAQNYFNVLPPGSKDSAMFVGDNGENYHGLLPADGDYTVRVYLMRPAARRGEGSSYTLTISVTGKALLPTPASRDALIPGTAYHVSARIQCVPPFETASRDCDVFVIRRGFDGTATIDVPGGAEKRSILFIKGKPAASTARAMDTLTSERRGDVTIVRLGASERYEIPDALVTGG